MHEVYPLEGLTVPWFGIIEIPEYHTIITNRDDLIMDSSEHHTTCSEIDDLKPGMIRNTVRCRNRNQSRRFGISRQKRAVCAAGKNNGPAQGNFPFDTPCPWFKDGVVVEIDVTTGLAGGIEMEQRWTNSWKVRS